MMNTEYNVFQNYRISGKISNHIYFFEYNGKKYGGFDNIILPLRIMMIFIYWKISDSALYNTKVIFDKSELTKLNPEIDVYISDNNNNSSYILSIFFRLFVEFLNKTENELDQLSFENIK